MYVGQEVKKNESDWPCIVLLYNKIRHHDHTHFTIYLRTLYAESLAGLIPRSTWFSTATESLGTRPRSLHVTRLVALLPNPARQLHSLLQLLLVIAQLATVAISLNEPRLRLSSGLIVLCK